MRVIGLTGSIACGKTTVSNYLSALQYPVIDGDQISRDLTVPGSPVISEIRQVFGDRFISDSGNLNRRALGQLVFRDESARQALDDLMAPHLLRETKSQLARHAADGASVCFLDMPLLFEKGYDRLCDSVWSVWLPEDVQLARLMSRDGFSEDDALRRIRAVMSSDEKASRANFVIDNSGSVQQTTAAVDRLLSVELNPAPPVHGPASSSPSAASVSASERDVMERPDAARKRTATRKVAWVMPFWIRSGIIAFSVLLLIEIGFLVFYVKSAESKRSERYMKLEENERVLSAAYPYPSREYDSMIVKYANDYNLQPAYVYAIILNESSFKFDAVSYLGARGLMQLMPDTAEWIAGKLYIHGYAFERMYDPESNIVFGCWYLNYLSNLFDGDLVCVTAAYHAGQGQVLNWLSDRSISDDGRVIDVSRLPKGETQQYVEKVIKAYAFYQDRNFKTSSADSDSSNNGIVIPSE